MFNDALFTSSMKMVQYFLFTRETFGLLDCRIAVVEVRYAIAGLGFMKGRLKLDRVVRQGEVIAAIAAETASLQNDVRQMKREEASRTSEYTHLRYD